MVQAPAGMEISGAMRTDTGLVRSHNEDAVAWVTPHDDDAALNRGSLALVADGMGGHAAGEVASALATSPAAWPPMPSATKARLPRLVAASSSCGVTHATESSFSVRTNPVSVRMAPMISMPAGA